MEPQLLGKLLHLLLNPQPGDVNGFVLLVMKNESEQELQVKRLSNLGVDQGNLILRKYLDQFDNKIQTEVLL